MASRDKFDYARKLLAEILRNQRPWRDAAEYMQVRRGETPDPKTDGACLDTWIMVALEAAARLEQEAPISADRFDREAFLTECGAPFNARNQSL